MKLITPLAIAFNPMKWQRLSTLTPGEEASTTKALIAPLAGFFAMTTPMAPPTASPAKR